MLISSHFLNKRIYLYVVYLCDMIIVYFSRLLHLLVAENAGDFKPNVTSCICNTQFVNVISSFWTITTIVSEVGCQCIWLMFAYPILHVVSQLHLAEVACFILVYTL